MTKRSNPRAIEIAIILGILIVSAGLVFPVLRSSRIRDDVGKAEQDLRLIVDAIHRFHKDVGVGPTRGRDGVDRQLHRLRGSGRLATGSYYDADEYQGWFEDHLTHNRPTASSADYYENWRGPYLPENFGVDPWGNSYIVVLYPMFLDDDRDCIVISAGPNGIMDSSYASPRDVIPAEDDIIKVIYDKSAADSAPLF